MRKIKKEIRTIQQKVEVRAADDGKKKIVGYAARFNELSELLGGWFKERILPGAFDGVIERSDVRALFNHDSNIVLGRNKSGTLALTVDERGLFYEIDPPETRTADELIISIERGDIDGSSFAFTPSETRWETVTENGIETDIRNIVKFDLIYDVSPVTYPAYPTATADTRSLDDIRLEKPQKEDHSKAIRSALDLKIKILEVGI